jgi:hypothetical protein
MRVRVPEGGSFMFIGKGHSHPLHDGLNQIRGVISTYASSMDLYSLRIEKGEIFTWKELNPHILEAIRIHLANDKSMKESGKAKYPSKEELENIKLMQQIEREDALEEAHIHRNRRFVN